MQRTPTKNYARIIAGGVIILAILGGAWIAAAALFEVLRVPAEISRSVDAQGVFHYQARGTSSESEVVMFISLLAAFSFSLAALAEILFRRRFGVSLLELYLDP